jgi:hypothetical protein
MTIDSLELQFSNGVSNYVISGPVPAPGFTLDAGADTTMSFLVDVDSTAVIGPDTIDARLVATEGTEQFVIDGAINTDVWTVQNRPLVEIDSVTISPSLASTGQTGVTGRMIITNQPGVYRSTAQIDSVDYNFLLGVDNVDTNFTITRITPPALPFILPAGASQAVDFTIEVNSNALDTTYTLDGSISYLDLNDNSRFSVNTAEQQDSLVVQTTSLLNITSLVITPDTVSQGQNNVAGQIIYENAGSASLMVTTAQLTYNPPAGFITNLVGRTTPFTVAGNTIDTLNYSITMPTSLGDTTIIVDGTISGIDLNSNLTTGDTAQTLIYLQTPANAEWAGTTEPAIFEVDTTVSFSVSVVNTGEAYIDLNTQTSLNLLTTPFSAILLSGTSPTKIAGGDTVMLIFTETNITGISPGDYAVQVTLNGTTTGMSYNQTLNTGQVTIGGQVFFTGGSVVPDVVLQGQPNITVNMIIGNDGSVLTIDSIGTTVIFRQSSVDITPQPTIVRTDTLDSLYHIPNNQLSFVFDVPPDFPPGEIEVWGQISLDGGSLAKQSITPITTFDVFGGSAVFYVSGSVSESQVVPRQEIAFNIMVSDSGTSGLALVPSLSYLEIDSSPVLRAGLSANYIVPAGDSSQISFDQITIPETITIDTSYSFIARLVGVQVNGDTLIDTLNLEPLGVLSPANITIANISIIPDVVRQYQSNVEIQYNLRNDGSSDARVLSMVPHFTRTGDSKDVTADWILSSILPEFPTTISAGESQLFSADYVLSAQADTGMIVPGPDILFNDIRTTNYVDTSYTLVAHDSVRVINPANLRIERLVLADSLAPNKPRVNIDETFILHLAVANLGADSANSVYISLLEDGVPVGQYTIAQIAPYDSQFIDISQSVSVTKPEPYSYTARIDSAFDATTGEKVNIDQPIDNREDIFADTPVLLNITSRIARPGGALDSVVSVGQQFEIDATATNDGTAPYDPGRVRLTVPENYTLLTQADSTYRENDPVISWQIQSNDYSQTAFDTIYVSLIDTSLDRNTGRSAGLGTFTDFVLIRSDSAAGFVIKPYITDPPGARDSILSTGQLFTVTTDISFTSSMEDSGRVAQLLLPGGYSVTDSTIKPLPDTVPDTLISWDIIARNNVISKLDSIRVRVFGIDGNSGLTVQGTSAPLTVKTVTRAELTLSAAITAPAGATDGRVSVGQNFYLSAVIANRGTAGVMPGDTGQVSIELPGNLSLISGGSTQPYVFGKPIVWGINVLSEISHSQMIVRIESTPLDENSEMPASTVTDSVIVIITIEQAGSIAIREVTPEDNTVSSGQTFIVSTIYELSSNVTKASARIASLPTGFLASPQEQGVISEDTLNWVIVAPENISQITDYTIDFTASGVDVNDTSTVIQGGDTTVFVSVEPKAKVKLNAEILSPVSAITKSAVSRGQRFEMRTHVSRDFSDVLAMADITGSTQITAFYDPLFELEGDSIRTVSQWDDSITWRFRAPDTVINASNFSFSITQAPLDTNSQLPAFVAGDNGARSFALSVTQENLVITNITDPVLDTLGIENNNFIEGSQNVPLMVFTAEYPGSASDTTTIKMDGVRLKFLEPIDDQEMNPDRVVSLIESITISNMQYLVDSVATDFAKPARRFITYMVPDTMQNPVDIRWNPPNVFLADSTDTVVVMVSFRPGAQHQSFRMALENVRAYDVDPDLTLTAVDEDLNPLPKSTLLTTAKISVIPEDPEEAFITYPNPFGKNQDYANIKFILETGGDVEIRIFTLVGELVWTKIVQGETPGIHDGAWDSKYQWDGKNDKGYTVLNGVYLCVLRLKEQGGGTKMYTKKIAYIK